MSARSSQLPVLTLLTSKFGNINEQLAAQHIAVRVVVAIVEFTGVDPPDNRLTLTLTDDGLDWIFG